MWYVNLRLRHAWWKYWRLNLLIGTQKNWSICVRGVCVILAHSPQHQKTLWTGRRFFQHNVKHFQNNVPKIQQHIDYKTKYNINEIRKMWISWRKYTYSSVGWWAWLMNQKDFDRSWFYLINVSRFLGEQQIPVQRTNSNVLVTNLSTVPQTMLRHNYWLFCIG